MATTKPRIVISLPAPTAEILEQASRETGLSKSRLISILITKHLENEKNAIQDLIPNSNPNKDKGEEST